MKLCSKCGAENRDAAGSCEGCRDAFPTAPSKVPFKWIIAGGSAVLIAVLGSWVWKGAVGSSSSRPAVFKVTDWNDMILIPAGESGMGSPEKGGYSNERPRHTVWLDAFYMDKHEVTFEQYDRFCDATGKSKPDDEGMGRGRRPVINISWFDAGEYCKWAGKRLPTEAEWEKACRGGTDTKWSFGDDGGRLGEYAWYGGNSGSMTHPAGEMKPNPYGLYDMHGNVWEWCADRYGPGYYSSSPGKNPKGPEAGRFRVLRGGSWLGLADNTRAAIRSRFTPDYRYYVLGCRCARSP